MSAQRRLAFALSLVTAFSACADVESSNSAMGAPSFLFPDAAAQADASSTGRDGGTGEGQMSSTQDGGAAPNASSPAGALVRGDMPTRETGLKDGPYRVKSTKEGFRNGEDFADATLWWPEDAMPPFAFVGIVPGWVSTEGDIQAWGPFLASHGIVAMTSSTNSPVTDLPKDRERALLDILKSIGEESTRAESPLKGKLDLTRQAVMGWSMGGGGALLAAESTPSLKAAVSLCGWNRPDFVSEYAYQKLAVPSLLLAASIDVLAGGQSSKFYESIPESTPKELFEIAATDHWGANSPKNQAGVVGLYGLSWLKVFLEGDERWRAFLKEEPKEASIFKTNLQ
ncbi:MAG: Lipase 1 [Pseudomonadota bacterium]